MNRHQRRAHAASDGIRRAENGRRLAVIRPEDPEKAIAMALEAERTQDIEMMAHLPDRVGCKYTFVGWAGRKLDQIVDAQGKVIGMLVPGDSFVTFENDDPTTAVKVEEPSDGN